MKDIPQGILRIGAAFAFLYPPIDAFWNADSWIGYFPPFMRGYVSDIALLHAFVALEIVIALWILSGKRIFIPSTLATILLLAIVILDASQFEILFRDLSIAAMTASLAFTSYAEGKRKSFTQITS